MRQSGLVARAGKTTGHLPPPREAQGSAQYQGVSRVSPQCEPCSRSACPGGRRWISPGVRVRWRWVW